MAKKKKAERHGEVAPAWKETQRVDTKTARPVRRELSSVQYSTNASDVSSRIAKRRADMPKIYRATYDKAVSGKSLRAAVNAFCLECVMWQREEVRLCPSVACPLWEYRPYKPNDSKPISFSKQASEGSDFAPESTKKGK